MPMTTPAIVAWTPDSKSVSQNATPTTRYTGVYQTCIKRIANSRRTMPPDTASQPSEMSFV